MHKVEATFGTSQPPVTPSPFMQGCQKCKEIQINEATAKINELFKAIGSVIQNTSQAGLNELDQKFKLLENSLAKIPKTHARIASLDIKKISNFINKHNKIFQNSNYKTTQKTIMEIALEQLDFDMIELFPKLGIDINYKNKDGLSPISAAVKASDPKLIRALANIGADVHLPFVETFTHALEDQMQLLVELGADPIFISAIRDLKRLGHLLKIPGNVYYLWGNTTYELPLEGNSKKECLRWLLESFQSYHTITSAPFPDILDALEHAYPLARLSNRDLLQRVHDNKPVLIMGGVEGNPAGHAIGIVLSKGLLMICNRGLGRTAFAIEIYKFNPDQIKGATIKKLKMFYPDPESFKQMVADLNLPFHMGIQKHDQTIGNCAWISAKTGLLGLLYAASLDKDQKIGYPDFVEYYKDFSYFAVINTLDHCFARVNITDTAFINKLHDNSTKKFLSRGKVQGQDLIGFPRGYHYVGEIRDQKPHGKGKLFYLNKMIYEGDYVDGLKCGMGTDYHLDGRISYRGEFNNNRWNGTGTIYYADGSIFEGEIIEGFATGKGLLTVPNRTLEVISEQNHPRKRKIAEIST